MKNALLFVSGALAAIILIPAVIIWSGAVDVAADTSHGTAVFNLLETARERSIAVRVRGIEAPPLADPAAVRRGAGNYDSMCTECHLAPGRLDTELSRGQYPAPPNLARGEPTDPARAYWIIKHGIKATGMPAWGKSMEDRYIWDMVALLQVLPQMSQEQYAQEVLESGGHSHDDSAMSSSDSAKAATPEERVHTHKDGSQHEH